MKIYEITSKTPNEQLINQQLIKLYEATSLAEPAAAVPGVLSRIGSGIGTIFSKGISLAKGFFAIKPFYLYYDNMKTAEENLAKLGNTPQAKSEFEKYHDVQMGLLISSVSAGLLSAGLLATTRGLFGLLRFIPVIGPIIAGGVNLLSNAAQIWVLEKLSSEEGRTAIAKLLTFEILGKNGVTFVGHLGNEAYSYFEKLFKDALDIKSDTTTNNEKPNDPNGSTTSDANANSVDPTKPPVNDEESFMADLFGTNKPVKKEEPLPNEYLGPRLQRNPTTGKVEMKPLQ